MNLEGREAPEFELEDPETLAEGHKAEEHPQEVLDYLAVLKI